MPISSTPIILWLHNDLRLSDHEAWYTASQHSQQVIPVFVHYKSIGAANRWWLHHSLASLRTQLRQLGGDLVLMQAENPESLAHALEKIAKNYQTNKIYCHQPPAPFDRTQNRVMALAPDLEFTRFKQGHTLVEAAEHLNGQGLPFKVYTPFYKAYIASFQPQKPFPRVTATPFAPFPQAQELEDLKLLPTIGWDADFYSQWSAGEEQAWARFQAFIDDQKIEHYETLRNRPDLEQTSRLSPHLHFGEISARQILWEIWSHPHKEWFVREIFWREFAYYIHHHFPHTFNQPFQAKWADFQWQSNPEALTAWQKGQTGIPLVDAGMRQLWHTGWMHNRVRMVVGSFLVKNLGLHWMEGAEWFEDTLLDADIAVNRTSWQWVAGCGVDAAPYFRVFNPQTQGEKFDPQAHYIKTYVPELRGCSAQQIHSMSGLPSDYPQPMVDLKASREDALARYTPLKST